MAATQIAYGQINPVWKIVAGLGIVLTAALGTVAFFSGKNAAGINTYKLLSNGSQEMSGSLLIASGSTTLYADSVNAKVGIGTQSPKAKFSIVGILSGSTLRADSILASSGLIIVKSSARVGSGALTVAQNAASATGVYVYASGAALLALDSYSKSATNAHILFGYQGNFDTALWRSATTTLKTNGSLQVVGTVSGSILKATTSLASSGSLAWEGAATGVTLTVSQGANFGGSGLIITSTGGLLWNNNSRNVDFRMKGQTNAALFYLDASADKIGIGTAAPKATLEVQGTLSGSTVNIGGKASPGVGLTVMNIATVFKNATITLQDSVPTFTTSIYQNTTATRIDNNAGSILFLPNSNSNANY